MKIVKEMGYTHADFFQTPASCDGELSIWSQWPGSELRATLGYIENNVGRRAGATPCSGSNTVHYDNLRLPQCD